MLFPRFVRWSALILLGVLCAAARADDAPAKLAVPSATTQAASLKEANEVYKDMLTQAKAPAQKAVVARQILQDAAKETDPGSRFALLTLAKSTAELGGDISIAFQAVDALDQYYQIDALAEKADVVANVAKVFHSPVEVRALLPQLDAAVVQALHANRYDIATQLSAAAVALVRPISDFALLKAALARQQEVKDTQAAYADVKTAIITLHDKPIDPDANSAVGRFRCFFNGDWANGMSMLILGSDPTLRDLAEREFEGPADVDAALALGDAWWDLADKNPGVAGVHIRRHAAVWYRSALPRLSVLAKAKVEKRLAIVDAESGPPIIHIVPVALIDTAEHFAANWHQVARTFYDARNGMATMTGRGELGGATLDSPWSSVTFDIRCTDAVPNGLAVRVNGASLAFRDFAEGAKGQFLPVVLTYDKARKVVSISVANHLLDSASITQDDFDKKLDLSFSWPGYMTRFEIHNITVQTVQTEPSPQ